MTRKPKPKRKAAAKPVQAKPAASKRADKLAQSLWPKIPRSKPKPRAVFINDSRKNAPDNPAQTSASTGPVGKQQRSTG